MAALNTLHDAVIREDIPVIQALIASGADVAKVDDDGNTALFIASREGNLEIVNALLKAGSDVNQSRNDGATPLYIASYNEHIEIVKALLKSGADIDKALKVGATPLYIASQEGYLEIVKALLKSGADVNKALKDGATPLCIATYKRHLEIVKVLLKAGANVDKERFNGATPLYIASEKGYLEIVRALIEAGADINKSMNDETTPLYIASHEGYPEIVRLLIENGGDVAKVSDDGTTPLYVASQEGHPEIVSLLIENGGDVNKVSNYGVSPLYIASQEGHIAVVNILLKAGADIKLYNVLQKALNGTFKSEINALILSNADPANLSNAPLKCFDPLMASEVNISISEHAIFYIQDSTGKTTSVGCLNEDTLEVYKSEPSYVFYKCKDSVPVSALHITPSSVFPTPYRLLNFSMRIYVKDSETQQLVVGKSYTLKPVEPIGRIASKSVVDGGSVVSALHCGPADGAYLYSIHKISVGGRRKRKTVRARLTKNRKTKKFI